MGKARHYQLLDWDSNFFGFKVAKISDSNLEWSDIKSILQELREKHIRTVYWEAESELPALDAIRYGGILVDLKTTFRADLDSIKLEQNDPENGIRTYSQEMSTQALEEIAIQANEFSRFTVDPNFSKRMVSDLYRKWVNNALRRIGTKEILVAESDGIPAGLITLGEKNAHGHIGLLSVDKQFRGARLGERLVKASHKWFTEHGYPYSEVTTQGNNLPACALYKKCHFSVVSKRYFYHFWL